jgi:hypothetical protein
VILDVILDVMLSRWLRLVVVVTNGFVTTSKKGEGCFRLQRHGTGRYQKGGGALTLISSVVASLGTLRVA